MFLQGLLSKLHWICLACSFGIVILTIYSGKHRAELVALLGHHLQGKKLPLEIGSLAGVLPMISYTGKFRPKGAFFSIQAPVVQKLDSAIHRINHYTTDKC